MKEGVGMLCAPFGAPIMPSPHMTGIQLDSLLAYDASPTENHVSDNRTERSVRYSTQYRTLFLGHPSLLA